MFNSHLFENSRPDGFPVLEIAAGAAGASPGFVPLKLSQLGGEIAGPLADLRLTQTFGYTREQCGQTLEAVYRFPLPGDAAVTGVNVRFGEVEITAELKAREQAETEYQEAVRQGRQAAFAARESPDVFTLRVAGLQPDQDVTVITRFVQLARPDGLNWTLRVPLTTAPRYVRTDEAGSRHAQGQPLALLRDPGHRFRLEVDFAECGDVTSATHPLDVEERGGDIKRVRLRGNEVLPDRDLVLSWRAAQDESRPGLRVLLHDDPAGGYAYFLALVAPPKAQAANTGVPRETVLLVDHSGSMHGAKWEASDWAVKQFLSGLTEQDTFALGLFHTTTNWFKQGGVSRESPHAVSRQGVENAMRFLEDSKDSGGTELGVALEQALNLRRVGGEASRHVLIVTDAEVTDGGRLLRLADAEAARPDRRRVSVLCIDAAPNAFLASELAERGGGIARFLTSAPQEEDITTALDAVLEDFAQPILADMRLYVNRPNAQASGRGVLPGRNAQSSSIDLGDLPRGRAVWVAGRVKRGNDSLLNFAVSVGGREVAHAQADASQAVSSRPALKALFGARRVLALEYLLTAHHDQQALAEQLARLGYDPQTVLQSPPSNVVYAENANAQPQDALKSLLIKEALEYGLASAETAFVARRTEAGKPIEGTVAVANALPSGWSDAFVGAAMPGGGAMAASAAMYGAPAPAMAGQSFDFDTKSALSDVSSAVMSAGASLFSRKLKRSSANTDARMRNFTPAPDAAAFALREEAVADKSVASGQALFAGVPAFDRGEAVLFDSRRPEDAAKLPIHAHLNKLEVRFPGGGPDLNALDGELMLLLYVEDMAMPRARVRLADLVRQGGARPLNVQAAAGQAVRIVLASSAPALPALELALYW